MKTLLKIGLVLLFSNYSFSQIYYSHYLDETSEWRAYSISFGGITQEMYSTTYFDGTENYNGYTYYKKYSIVIINGETVSDSNYYILYREDSNSNFYVVNPNTGIEQIDFQNFPILNAQIGDNFSNFPNHQIDNCSISSINNIAIDGLILKQLIGVFDESTGIAEGIGEIGTICLPTLDGGGGLSCYTKQGETIQFGNIDCDLFPVAQRQNLNTLQTSNFKVQVYPNPTTNSVYFDNSRTSFNNVSICNALGQEIKQQSLGYSSNEKVDLLNLSSGIYFLKLINSNNENTTIKVVKE